MTDSNTEASFEKIEGKWWIFAIGILVAGLFVLISCTHQEDARLRAVDANLTVTVQQAEFASTMTAAAVAQLTQVAGVTPGTPTVAPTEPPTPDCQPGTEQYTAYPKMTIDPKKKYTATIKLDTGDIVLNLFADKAPKTVNNFVFLAREGFYDCTTFHRVLDQFMAQGGDPTGTGMGGPGYQFEDETDTGLTFDKAGLLAMANAGPGTNGSQFFITFVPTDWLNGKHTIFGEITEKSLPVLRSIRLRNPDTDRTPGTLIRTITITEK